MPEPLLLPEPLLQHFDQRSGLSSRRGELLEPLAMPAGAPGRTSGQSTGTSRQMQKQSEMLGWYVLLRMAHGLGVLDILRLHQGFAGSVGCVKW